MLCTPALSVEVVKDAVPLLIVPVPRAVAPSKKVIVPVTPAGTVAVKVTTWLTLDGFSDEVNETPGDALLTVCVVLPVAGPLFVSPPKVAVIGSLPTGRVVVVIVTVPVVGLIVPLPTGFPPLVMVTVPVVPGGKVVVIVTGFPKVLGPEVVTVMGGVVLLTTCVSVPAAEL
jgi:hypothetical protein